MGGPCRDLLPDGYRPAAIGAAVFAGGGLVDLGWHLAFGVEQGIDALLSPSHLILLSGAALMFSGPILAVRRDPARDRPGMRVAATVAALSLSLVVAFALSYLSSFVSLAPTFDVGHYREGTVMHLANEARASLGLAAFLTTALVVTLPIAFFATSGPIIPGTAALFLTVHAVLALLVVNFTVYGAALVLVVLAAGVVVDGAIHVVQGAMSNGRARGTVIAAIVSAGLVSSQLISVAWLATLRWSAEMGLGVVVLVGLLVALVVWIGSTSAMSAEATHVGPVRRSTTEELVR